MFGDAFAGQTFRADFRDFGIGYTVVDKAKSELYEELEPRLNAGEVELLDVGKLQEQLLTLVWRGARIDHQPGDHDDYANACAGAVYLAAGARGHAIILSREALQQFATQMPQRNRFGRSAGMPNFPARQLGYR